MLFKTLRSLAVAVLVAVAALAPAGLAGQTSTLAGTVLKPADTVKLLPQSVYYKGQSAQVQIRNSGGVKFADGFYVLAAMVDTSGYSTDVAAKYQAYLIAEVPLKVGGQALAAGVYGLGFVGGKVEITDVGGHDVLTLDAANDAGMKRPMPLQVTADADGGYRLYSGRQYVGFTR